MLIFIVQLVKSFISLSATLMRHNILMNNHLKAKYPDYSVECRMVFVISSMMMTSASQESAATMNVCGCYGNV